MGIYNIYGVTVTDIYNASGGLLGYAYDVDQELLCGVEYDQYTVDSYCSVSLGQMQGFDIYSGVIFQYRANSSIHDVMCTIDVATSSIIQNNIPCVSAHGDSASFSREFYNDNDEFPLIYVSADTTPTVYVNRVTRTSSALIKTFSFPIAYTGYSCSHAYDEDEKIMYILGYTEDDYLSDDGGNNKTLVSIWDMDDLTDNGDGTYTPAFISSYEIPFIYCMQGLQFKDDMIWVSSGYVSHAGYVYALKPDGGAILHTIDLETTTEVEGIAFINDRELVVSLQGGTYRKYTFGVV